MTDMMIKKSIKRVMAVLAAAGVFCGVFPETAAAHFLSSAEEWCIGNEAIQGYEKQHSIWQDDSILTLQNCLVQANHDEIKLREDGEKRYLSNIKVSGENDVNAFTFPGGFIYVTQDMIDFCRTRAADGTTDMNRYNTDSIYNNGTLAFVLGHEMGHFVNEDYLRAYDKRFAVDMLFGLFGGQGSAESVMVQQEAQDILNKMNTRQMSLRVEEQADEKGLRYVSRVPVWSIGNGAIFFHRLCQLEAANHTRQDWQRSHSKSDVRLRRVLGKMKEISGGRVEFKEDRFYLDHQLFMGTGRLDSTAEVDGLERTYYVAGQIASAIEAGLWSKACVAVAEEKDVFVKPHGDGSRLVVCAGKKNRNGTYSCQRVIGIFECSAKELQEASSVRKNKEVETVRFLYQQAAKPVPKDE